jgi:hypothetical protein
LYRDVAPWQFVKDANMKRPISAGLLFLMVCCCFSRQAFSRDEATTELRAGAAAVDISPTTLPAIRNGGFLQATSDRVDDPLHARCLVLEQGDETIAICIVDSCMFSTELCDTIKSLVTKRIGLPSNRILIAATHTHSAPSAMPFCLACGQDDPYVQFVAPVVAHGIVAAHDRLRPAKIGWTSIEAGELTNCRRWITRSDRLGTDPFGQRTVRAMMHPGYQNPDYVGPAGPIDPQLSVLSVLSATDDAPLCVLANFSMHYFGAGQGFSADYFGEVANRLEAEIGKGREQQPSNVVAIMSQGTSGDLHWMDYSQPRRGVTRQEYSQAVAIKIFEAWKKVEYRADATLAMIETRLKIPRRLPSVERLEWARSINTNRGDRLPQNHPEVYAQQAQWIHENPEAEVVLQAIRIGELGIAALPNEVYGITGLKLKQQSPLTSTFNLELANGGEGYIPPPEQHRLGGYTTWPARSAGLEEQAEPKIVEAVLSLLESVSGKKRRSLVDPPNNYSQAILAAEPVAYWRLGDMNAIRVTDATGRHHAEYQGGVAFYLPGPNGSGFSSGTQGNRAVHFAGGHIRGALADLTPEYSVSMWCWNGLPTDAQPITGTLFARGDGNENDHETLLIGGNADPTSAGRLIFRAGSSSFVGTTLLATKAWHHIFFIRTTGRVRVYLDGQPDADLDGKVDSPLASSQVFLGGDGQTQYPFDGKLDEVAIFTRAITAGEILRHYQISGMKPPPRPTPPKLPAALR